MIKVMIVDDHDLVRTGLQHILQQSSDIETIAEAASGEQALRDIRTSPPDVMLLDVNMPGLSGFEVCDRLSKHHKAIKVIILTAHVKEPYPSRLLEAGASGYLTKSCAAEELHEAIRKVHSGQRYVGVEIAQQLALAMLPGSKGSPFEGLSAREMEVVLMLTEGLTMQDMAENLSLSPKTVATYKYRIYDKLGIINEVALTRLALKEGLLENRY